MIAARIDDDLENLPSGDSLEPVIASLSSHEGGAKEEAHQSLIAAIDSVRFGSLLDDLVDLAMSPPFRARSRRPRWLRRRLTKAVRKTERLVAVAASLDSPERDAALHEVRKQAKHVRYAAETLEPRFGKKARRLARSFESFQEILGEHHDAVVTRGVFHDARARAGLDEGGSSYDLLIAREDARAAKADSEFVQAWKRALGMDRTAGWQAEFERVNPLSPVASVSSEHRGLRSLSTGLDQRHRTAPRHRLRRADAAGKGLLRASAFAG